MTTTTSVKIAPGAWHVIQGRRRSILLQRYLEGNPHPQHVTHWADIETVRHFLRTLGLTRYDSTDPDVLEVWR